MLCFLITCLSFILVVSKPLFISLSTLKITNMQMLSLSWSLAKESTFLISWFRTSRMFSSLIHGLVVKPAMKKAVTVVNVEEKEEVSLLDLPDLVLECILERLSPAGLCSTTGVCRSLRERCTSDYFWEKHMKQKWDRVISAAAYEKWQSHIASRERPTILDSRKQKGFFEYFLSIWPLRSNRSKVNDDSHEHRSLPEDSINAWYLSLETGKFWFPAQVYNRENGHVGFMLSCYDAEVCYDIRTDTFRARYSARGGQTMEENIEWNRLRKPAVDTAAHHLHVSDCLSDLKPSDYIEIQWRRSKEFPYGWWYGVVGHLESCNGDECNCQCHTRDTMVLEFKQYTPGSQWRRVFINRKDHQEVGNEADGFYGGIRKLCHEEEISMWKHFWTTSALE